MASDPAEDCLRGIAAKSFEYEAGERTGWHTHEQSQLVYAIKGTMTVSAQEGLWIVPSLRAVWIPGGVRHDVLMNTKVSMRSAYFSRIDAPMARRGCFVVPVSPLLRELLVAATSPSDDTERRQLIHALIQRELRSIDILPMHLPRPSNPVIEKIAKDLIENPSIKRSSRDVCSLTGWSERSFSRHFKLDTGLTFRQWRQQAILVRALQRLACGDSITAISFDLGYESVSAFTHMFRLSLGTTPAKYFVPE